MRNVSALADTFLLSTYTIFKRGEIIMSKSTVYLTVSDAGDRHSSKDLKQGLDELRGVISVSVAAGGETVVVDYDSSGVDAEDISRQVQELGYDAQIKWDRNHIM